jgi:hypothetical protein
MPLKVCECVANHRADSCRKRFHLDASLEAFIVNHRLQFAKELVSRDEAVPPLEIGDTPFI